MKIRLGLLLAGLLVAQAASAMVWQVYVGSNFFAPDSLVVAFGDTVRWTALEGTHNVVAQSDPPLFLSGVPTPAPWTYEYEFRLPEGNYGYVCTAHAEEMRGVVTVIPYGTPPNLAFVAPSVPQLAVTGLSFRFRVAPTDDEQDLVGFAVSVDDTDHFTPWSPDADFLIADLSLELLPERTTLISNAGYQPGLATFYFRAIDSRGFVSPIIDRMVNMEAGHLPELSAAVAGTYHEEALYLDRSAYFSAGAELQMNFSADAGGYYGDINGYRSRVPDGEWSAWSATPELRLVPPDADDYQWELQARDMAGALSVPLPTVAHLVAFGLSDSILVVDETRDGSGAAGLPSDAQVDDFYSQRLTAYALRLVDYNQNQAGGVSYVSPYTLGQAGLVLWHSDDRTSVLWSDETRILGDYLSRGGRVLLAGWDVMKPYLPVGDSIIFQPMTFPAAQMGLETATRNAPRTVAGMEGQNGFPGLRFDSLKTLTAWHGVLDQGWVFRPQAGATVLGGLMVTDSLTNPRAHRPVGYLWDAVGRIAVLGVPLYFCRDADVQALLDTLLPLLLAPSAVPHAPQTAASGFALEQNYPNPFNAQTEIRFSLATAGRVSVRLYDVLGRQVATLLEGPLAAGGHRLRLDGAALPSGVYFVELRQGANAQSRKLLLLK